MRSAPAGPASISAEAVSRSRRLRFMRAAPVGGGVVPGHERYTPGAWSTTRGELRRRTRPVLFSVGMGALKTGLKDVLSRLSPDSLAGALVYLLLFVLAALVLARALRIAV